MEPYQHQMMITGEMNPDGLYEERKVGEKIKFFEITKEVRQPNHYSLQDHRLVLQPS